MEKKNLVRAYNFSDAHLIQKGKEKISFMRRDKTAFATFGITETMIAEFEKDINDFADSITDIEAKSSKMVVTQSKNSKAEELRTAIRNVMKHIELAFDSHSARYKQFGTKALVRKPDSDLLITAKVVVQVGKIQLSELLKTGITTAMLDTIQALCHDFEQLIHEQNDKIWERNSLQENRIMQGNSIYATLTRYTAIGFAIWETSSAAKYNDYIIYNRVAKNRQPEIN
ncbi:hypothetical protein [Flavobacterium sp. N3904]|uniref:hypothetical protein n=1 Tax=Flavobacterium sp. N3904 TaxID=2986835 RepID=UPI0022257DDB|nr:hypothetical protein [Flavobacterium sp. N3904]